MSTYEKYHLVNQRWMKKIPSHWNYYRIKRIFAKRNETNNPIITDRILSLTAKQGVVPYANKEGTGGNKPKNDLTKYCIAHPDDLLVNCMNVVSGSAGVSRYFGAISPVYYALYPRFNCNIRYFHYIFRLVSFQRSLLGLGKGILMHESDSGKLNTVRMRISMDYLGGVNLPVPPRAEQDQIVRYLDWQISKINKLIAAKKKQIVTLKAALQEKIEGLLFAHSIVETVRLKALGKFSKGGGFSRNNLVEEANYPAILYGDIYTQYIYKTDVITHFIDKDAYKASRKISKGDIVLAGTGETKDEIGKPILYLGDDTVAVGGDVIVFHPNNEVNSEYILYQLYSQAALIYRYIHGKGDIIVHISPAMLGNTVLKLPSEKEQKSTVTKIDTAISRVSATVKTISDEIGVLHEYSTRLISDVVTGQIDVHSIEVPDFEMVEVIDIDDTLNEDEIPEEAEEQEE